jgi:peroxiredoxin
MRKDGRQMVVKVGDRAPSFKLVDQNERIFQLSRYRGKKVLLSWHPQAFTSVCTDQVRSLERNWDRFEKANTVPVSLSVDTTSSKYVWAAAISVDNVRLLCDFWPHGAISKLYGLFNEESGMSFRANIIVDENGKVIWAKVYPGGHLPELDEIFAVLEK